MCKVKDIRETEKSVVVVMANGNIIRSNWYNTEEKQTEDENAESVVYRDLLTDKQIEDENVSYWYVSRKMDDKDTVYITEHAMSRLKERCGWGRHTSLRMIKKIYNNGLKSNEVKGRLGAWIKNREAERAKEGLTDESYRMYGEHLYVFRRNTLVTVIPAPRKGTYYNPIYKEYAA